MATLIETGDIRMLIDPGVALAPRRCGYPPHRIEVMEMEQRWDRIRKEAERCDVLVVTHYHYDHHDPAHPEIYRDKVVLLKEPGENINRSQRARAGELLRVIRPIAKRVGPADGKEFMFGRTKVGFSRAVCHGIDRRLGYVVEVLVEAEGERVVHTSDVEGPALKEQAGFVLKSEPGVVICDGPMTYMLGYRYPVSALEGSMRNLITLLERGATGHLVLDHHLMRDAGWRGRVSALLEVGERADAEVTTAAEFAGEPENPLESRRRELHMEGRDEHA